MKSVRFPATSFSWEGRVGIQTQRSWRKNVVFLERMSHHILSGWLRFRPLAIVLLCVAQVLSIDPTHGQPVLIQGHLVYTN